MADRWQDIETAPSEAQVKRLIDASENLAAYLAMDACRVIAEWPDDANLVPYLENLPVKVVREFDAAVAAIQWGKMDTADAEIAQRRKYEAAQKLGAFTPPEQPQ